MTNTDLPPLIPRDRREKKTHKFLDDRMVLEGEVDWLLEGSSEQLDQIEESLGEFCERLTDKLLSISFGNCIGLFDIPELGRVEVVSGKWDRAHFEWMLSDLSEVASALPFSAGVGGALPYDRSVVSREDVVYHAFVYLRHILSDDCPRQDKLLSALQAILHEPHRRLERKNYSVPIEASRKVEPAALVQMVSGSLVEVRNPRALQTPLAVALGGRLPERIEETRAELTLDTPENRFVKAFLNFAMGVIKATEEAFSEAQTVFTRGVLDDCATMARKLHPVIRNSLWSEVGEMVHVPASSTVLQRRRGYKEVFQHFTKLRLANRIPLEKDELFQLLEVKDIALLYEIWTFFALTKQLTQLLGSPVSAGRPRPTPAEIKVPWDLMDSSGALRIRTAMPERIWHTPRITSRLPASIGSGLTAATISNSACCWKRIFGNNPSVTQITAMPARSNHSVRVVQPSRCKSQAVMITATSGTFLLSMPNAFASSDGS